MSKKIVITTEQFESLVSEYTRTLKDARRNKKGSHFSANAIKTNPLRFRPAQREGIENKILYSAVVLDEDSHRKLLDTFADLIPEGWKEYAHHMTIVFGSGVSEEQKEDIGKEFPLKVKEIGVSDDAIAVKVEGYPSQNTIPHITVATSPEGKPKMSNDIKDWHILKEPMTLNGTVYEIAAR